jgi:hypothetical protein
MKKIFPCILLLVLGFSLTSKSQSEFQLWNQITEDDLSINGKRQIIPQKYIVFNVNAQILKTELLRAPHERQISTSDTDFILSLPAPDGSIKKYKVVKSEVMAPELAAAFPDIKTYSVKGIDDPYATGKLDFTEYGFHGMIFGAGGDFFIDPYCENNVNDYIVYYAGDFMKDPSHLMPEDGVLEEESRINKKDSKTEYGKKTASSSAAACVGPQLRSYRLAIACTGEYAIAATGNSSPTIAQTLAKVVTSVNRVDGVYEKEVAIRLVLVPTTTLVLFTDPSTDPFTGNANNNASTLINLSQSVITSSIGTANFDIGHTFSTGAGGLAFLYSVCNSSNKARGVTGSSFPVNDPYDIDFVAHEIGHQFGGNHSFNAVTGGCAGNRSAATSAEPGSGITIMGYAGLCSLNDLGTNSIPYFHAISYDEIVHFTNNAAGNSCATIINSGNAAPIVTGSGNYTIPKSTPFTLTGSAVDPDGDPIVYSWEETDSGLNGENWNSGNAPYFRSYAPSSSPSRTFPSNITIDGSGPFHLTYPSDPNIYWPISTPQSVTWDVNNTDMAPVMCDSVRILLSYNQGQSFFVIASSMPNTGFATITVPTLSATVQTCRIRIECKNNIFFDVSNNNFTISTDPTAGLSTYMNDLFHVRVQPNPSEGIFKLQANQLDINCPTFIKILDVVGKEVKRLQYSNAANLNTVLDLSDLENGVYLLEVENRGQRTAQRLVKQ